ncbi:diguanylate cyclase domain-containing protein [Massilia aerilata]|uniref:Diguanylate cyclase domain-containing protein n=1 Tax=Massilia aerilata TaxID=453817 RepID=A0ABW0S2C8_9BURK
MLRFIQSFAIPARFAPALEDACQADLAGDKVRMLYVASILCSVLVLCFGCLDAVTLPSNVAGAWTARAIVVLSALAITAAVRLRPQVFLRHYTLSMCGTAIGWSLGIEAIIMQSSPTDLAWGTYYAGLLIVSMALYAWTYLRPLYAAMTGIAVVGSYVAEAVFVQGMIERGQWPLLVQNSFFLAGANLVGMMSLILRERFSRQAFLLKNALAHDLKLEEEAKRQSQHRSEHDPLTGLPNRVRFLRRLDELLAARQGAAAVAVLFLDLDGFKPVNDRHGHAAGDHMLAVIAERIRGAIRTSDLAARLGGDEFVVAVPLADANGDLVVRRMSAALRAAIAEPVDYQGQYLRVTVSIGAALCPHDAASAGELLHQADQDMYASKRHRKQLVT